MVIDFIDMVLESNRELVLRRLLECLARDRTKHQVAEVTSLGLVQMTRKRVGAGLLEAFSTPCECCNGRGVIITFDPEADVQAAHHVHTRGGAGNGSRGAQAATPAAVAARSRQDGRRADALPADTSQAVDTPQVADTPQAADTSQASDGQQADGDQAHGQAGAPALDGQAAVAPVPEPAETPRPAGNSRRRRRKPSASAAAEPAQAQDGAA